MKYEGIAYINGVTNLLIGFSLATAIFGCGWLFFMYSTSNIKDSMNFGAYIYNDIKNKYINIFICIILILTFSSIAKVVFNYLMG